MTSGFQIQIWKWLQYIPHNKTFPLGGKNRIQTVNASCQRKLFKWSESSKYDWLWLSQPSTHPSIMYDNVFFLILPHIHVHHGCAWQAQPRNYVGRTWLWYAPHTGFRKIWPSVYPYAHSLSRLPKHTCFLLAIVKGFFPHRRNHTKTCIAEVVSLTIGQCLTYFAKITAHWLFSSHRQDSVWGFGWWKCYIYCPWKKLIVHILSLSLWYISRLDNQDWIKLVRKNIYVTSPSTTVWQYYTVFAWFPCN